MKRKIKTYTTKTLLFLKSRRHLYSIGLDGTLRLRLPYNNKLIFLKLVHFSYCSTILSLRTENATFLFRARGTRQQLKSKPNRYPIVNCCTLRWWIRLIDGIMEYDSFFFRGEEHLCCYAKPQAVCASNRLYRCAFFSQSYCCGLNESGRFMLSTHCPSGIAFVIPSAVVVFGPARVPR